jgi:hypothetical protein
MLGNILIIFTILSLFGLISVTASPMPGGDRGVGAAFAMVICIGAFFVFTGLLAWAAGARNCFDWLETSGGARSLLILFGWLAIAVAICSSAVFKGEWHNGEFPVYLKWLSQSYTHYWLPFLVLGSLFYLFNMERTAGAAPEFVKIPIMAGFSLSVLMCLGIFYGALKASVKQQAAKAEYAKNQDDEQHDKHLAWIAEQKPSDPIVNILALTGRYHDADIRDSAIAKVKSHPNWEAEMIELLSETEFDTEVYHFIDGNQVDHPELFVEPINRSIRRVAEKIKSSIKDSNNLQDWHFEHLSLERLFRAIDEQFSVPGADYRPAVLELRKALDTPKPERFKDVKFSVTPLVDHWLKQH